jgi:hypothetical protein
MVCGRLEGMRLLRSGWLLAVWLLAADAGGLAP